MVSSFTIRDKVLLGTIACYLLLNMGFQQLRIPPVGTGVPVGELFLLILLLGVGVFKTVGRLNKAIWALPFVVWWIYGLSRAMLGMPRHGLWALRDASQVVDSLFLLLGFALALNTAKLERCLRFMYRVFFLCAIYDLSSPVGKFLSSYVPHIKAAGGYSIPLIFIYGNAATILITESVILMLQNGPYVKGKLRYLLVAIFLGLALGIGQSRTSYVQVIFVILLLLFLNRRTLAKWTTGVAVALLLILLVPATGIELKGRLGKVSLSFMTKHFESISGDTEDQAVSGAANGVVMRLGWWTKIERKLTSNPGNLAFGLGYGMPLVDFTLAGGTLVREPHNSFISVAARLGVLGAVAWLAMHGALFWTWFRGFRLARLHGWKVDEARLLALLIFCSILLIGTAGEDVLEKPFNAAPYYFFWGIVIAYVRHLRAYAASLSRQHAPAAWPAEAAATR